MKIYNIFISHAWKYTEHYNKVVEWLDEAQEDGEFYWKNYSVPEHDPKIDPNTKVGMKTLENALEAQIKPASIVLVISGMYVSHSEWIEFEIDKSCSLDKYIIGIEPWGQQKTPSKVSENADSIVGWNKLSVVNCIKNL